MSKISDMYEQIKLQQYTLMKTKLQEAVMARKEKRELNEEEKEDYTFTYDEVNILGEMLKEQGFKNGKDFINVFDSDYESPNYSVFVVKIAGDYIELSTDSWYGKDIPNITDIESILEKIKGFSDVKLGGMPKVSSLTDIDLEQIQIGGSSRENENSIQKLSKSKTTKDIRQEFEESLLRDDVVEYYLSKTPEELEAKFGLEVARMVGFEQKNMHHCYDLWGHTLHTVEAVDTTGLTEEQAKKLKVAAFFHDIGKPDVTGFNPKTKQQTFYNHAVHSVDIAKPILENLGYSESEINQIGFFIGHHDDFINYKPSLDYKQKGHAFFREINPSTVSEIVVQNQYDFNKLGFESYLPTHTESEETNKRNNAINNENKLKIRYICSALANDGKVPEFKDFKGRKINLDVNLEEVKDKMFSGMYNAEYVPTLEDYNMLLELCKADAKAQEEIVKNKDGQVVDSKKRKIETLEAISKDMPEAYRRIENRSKEQKADLVDEILEQQKEIKMQEKEIAELSKSKEKNLNE